eukprot:TRINITY_DN1036_c0_g1_i6.p1 TRINITY_DN1036_c0_g1~~TRINITY_DN1036_c0_g1_i6.p1  ORF type:complete len:346 (-),score=163.50 TRINITY_DN1036_c0_g1_i6:274-1275(-)
METEILLNREVEVVSGGSLTLVAFTLNFIVGSGILGLPYAFIESGLILSILLLALSAFISFVTINWVIEISSRAQAYSKVYNQAGIQSEEVFLLENTVSSMHEKEEDKFENFYITRTKFTMNQLCGLFLGKTGQIFFEIALIFFVICTLWVYVAVFGSSLVSVLPFGFTKTHECDVSSDVFEQNCQNAYYCCVAIYAFLMTILCIVDISKLIALQMALTCFTVLCVLLMVSTTLVAMFNTPYQPPSSSSSSSRSHDSKLTVILVTEENPNTILEKEEVLLSKGRIPLRNLLTKWRLSSVEWVEGETPLGMMADGYSDCAFNGLPSIRLWGTHL